MGSGSSTSHQTNSNSSNSPYILNNANAANVIAMRPPPPPQSQIVQNEMSQLNSMNNFLNLRNQSNFAQQNNPNAIGLKNPSKTVVLNTDIGLRKKTVQLVHNKKNEFFLCFTYDCVAEIEISIFMFVEEKKDFHMITKELVPSNKAKPMPSFIENFPAGKKMDFPKCYPINFDLFPENFFFEHKDSSYPLVIKMRKNPIQSPNEKKILYHYLGFIREEKETRLKFLRQKIEIDKDAYEIEEIYGINTSNLSKETTNVAEVGDTEKECVICFSDKIDTIIMPCRHMCLCLSCTNSLQKSNKPQTRKCPICRKDIESFIRLQREETKK